MNAPLILSWRQQRAQLIQTMKVLLESHDAQELIDAVKEAQYAEQCELTQDDDYNDPRSAA